MAATDTTLLENVPEIVDDPHVTLAINTTAVEQMTVNGVSATSDGAGTFSATLALVPGENTLTIVAKTANAAAIQTTRTVVYFHPYGGAAFDTYLQTDLNSSLDAVKIASGQTVFHADALSKGIKGKMVFPFQTNDQQITFTELNLQKDGVAGTPLDVTGKAITIEKAPGDDKKGHIIYSYFIDLNTVTMANWPIQQNGEYVVLLKGEYVNGNGNRQQFLSAIPFTYKRSSKAYITKVEQVMSEGAITPLPYLVQSLPMEVKLNVSGNAGDFLPGIQATQNGKTIELKQDTDFKRLSEHDDTTAGAGSKRLLIEHLPFEGEMTLTFLVEDAGNTDKKSNPIQFRTPIYEITVKDQQVRLFKDELMLHDQAQITLQIKTMDVTGVKVNGVVAQPDGADSYTATLYLVPGENTLTFVAETSGGSTYQTTRSIVYRDQAAGTIYDTYLQSDPTDATDAVSINGGQTVYHDGTQPLPQGLKGKFIFPSQPTGQNVEVTLEEISIQTEGSAGEAQRLQPSQITMVSQPYNDGKGNTIYSFFIDLKNMTGLKNWPILTNGLYIVRMNGTYKDSNGTQLPFTSMIFFTYKDTSKTHITKIQMMDGNSLVPFPSTIKALPLHVQVDVSGNLGEPSLRVEAIQNGKTILLDSGSDYDILTSNGTPGSGYKQIQINALPYHGYMSLAFLVEDRGNTDEVAFPILYQTPIYEIRTKDGMPLPQGTALIVNDPYVDLEIKTTDVESVSVNGRDAQPDGTDTYAVSLVLAPGENKLTFDAKTAAGSTFNTARTVVYSPQAPGIPYETYFQNDPDDNQDAVQIVTGETVYHDGPLPKVIRGKLIFPSQLMVHQQVAFTSMMLQKDGMTEAEYVLNNDWIRVDSTREDDGRGHHLFSYSIDLSNVPIANWPIERNGTYVLKLIGEYHDENDMIKPFITPIYFIYKNNTRSYISNVQQISEDTLKPFPAFIDTLPLDIQLNVVGNVESSKPRVEVSQNGVRKSLEYGSDSGFQDISVDPVQGIRKLRINQLPFEGMMYVFFSVEEGGETDTYNALPLFYSKEAASELTSTITAEDATITADGISTTTITIQLKDADGKDLTGEGGFLDLSASKGIISPAIYQSGGRYAATLTSTTALETSVIRATINGKALAQSAQVEFVAGKSDANRSAISASVDSLPADGQSASTVTVVLQDSLGHRVQGKQVELRQGNGRAVITPIQAVTDSSGQAEFIVASTKAETIAIEAVVAADQILLADKVAITFVPGPVDGAVSSVTALPATVTADGYDRGVITVTLLDAHQNPWAGKKVRLLQGAGHSIIQPSEAVTDADGKATFTVTNTRSETVTYTASNETDGITLSQEAQIGFTAGVVDQSKSFVLAAPSSVVADGKTKATITVVLVDTTGNRLENKVVRLDQGSGRAVISPSRGNTDANGQVQFSVKNDHAETVMFTVFDETDQVTLREKTQVIFTEPNSPTPPPPPPPVPTPTPPTADSLFEIQRELNRAVAEKIRQASSEKEVRELLEEVEDSLRETVSSDKVNDSEKRQVTTDYIETVLDAVTETVAEETADPEVLVDAASYLLAKIAPAPLDDIDPQQSDSVEEGTELIKSLLETVIAKLDKKEISDDLIEHTDQAIAIMMTKVSTAEVLLSSTVSKLPDLEQAIEMNETFTKALDDNTSLFALEKVLYISLSEEQAEMKSSKKGSSETEKPAVQFAKSVVDSLIEEEFGIEVRQGEDVKLRIPETILAKIGAKELSVYMGRNREYALPSGMRKRSDVYEFSIQANGKAIPSYKAGAYRITIPYDQSGKRLNAYLYNDKSKKWAAITSGTKAAEVERQKDKVTFTAAQLGKMGVAETNVQSIRVEKRTVTAKPGEELQIKVIARYADRSEADITLDSETTYQSSNTNILTVNEQGVVAIAKDVKDRSRATITIAHNGKMTKVYVTVRTK
ncbi:Ig-like domain-containing protein [Brevibacillus migulae]|uniref:Ig-like domain-containing protein n=1 Tax=Brevibacillus migulae TaxID=1644114 RepID=UPI00142FF7CC|nr:invasin domain 3-containing protein [Brevibacillus migulae]